LYSVHLDKTKDKAFIMLVAHSFQTTENHFLDANRAEV
jgi:hypothetical protein